MGGIVIDVSFLHAQFRLEVGLVDRLVLALGFPEEGVGTLALCATCQQVLIGGNGAATLSFAQGLDACNHLCRTHQKATHSIQ